MENINHQQQQNFERREQPNEQKPKIKVCKHCGATLDDDMAFCPECGEKFGGKERECPICKRSTTSEICPNCGSRVIPLVCPQCGKESCSDFCEDCGNIINVQLKQFIEQPQRQIRQMSQEKAEEIKNKARKSITPELRQFLNKIEEHRILLEEREFFNKREKRIIKVFGQNPFELIEQSPEEKAFMIKMYEGLRKIVVDRRKKLIDEKMKKHSPKNEEEEAEKTDLLRKEVEAKRIEMEKRYNELLANVTNDVQKAQLAEQKRIEEERLRKEVEERERRRKEEERKQREKERLRREKEERELEEMMEYERIPMELEAEEEYVLGDYIYDGEWRDTLHIENRSGSEISGTACCSLKHKYGESTEEFIGTVYGSSISLRVTDFWAEGPVARYNNFKGTISDCTIDGYWTIEGKSAVAHVTYYKY